MLPRRIPKPEGASRTFGRAANGVPRQFLFDVVLNYAGDDCLEWPFARTGDGYGGVWVDGRRHTVSRYVCEHVHGPPATGQVAAHSCGRGQFGCVSPRHVRWATQAENCADKLQHGKHTRGERHRDNKLTEAQAREILARTDLSWAALARLYGVSKGAIQGIKSGKNWSHLHDAAA